MILLRLLSWQYARTHPLRCLLTTTGIVLGVAVFVGMRTANQSVLAAFNQTVGRIAGSTQLQVSAGETGLEESVLDRVQAVSEVRVAVPIIEAVANTGIKGQGNLLILGVDMMGDRSLRGYDLEGDQLVDDPLIFLAQPDSIILSDTFARSNGFTIGSHLPMRTMDGGKQFTVRGIMKSGGLASAFGGNLAVMDIYAVQKVFGRGRHFDRIDVAVKDGVRVEDCQARLKSLLGPGFEVEPPSARGAQFESLSRVYATSADLTSAFALFIGMFIIFNTFSIAVAQRRNEIGVLRALGATRGQIRALFLGESFVIGLAGSILGVGFGLLIARGLAGYIAGLLGEVYGVAHGSTEISTDPKLILFALAIGVAASLVAGILPARNAARIDPVRALRKNIAPMPSAGESRARRLAAAAALGGSLACLALHRFHSAVYIAFGLTMVAALLLAPSLSLWLSRAVRPLLKLALPVEGTLAADSLIQAPPRTSGAVAALMFSLALVVALGGIGGAIYGAIADWARVAFNADLFVTTSDRITSRSYRFPAAVGDALAAIPGVEEVQRVRTPRVTIRGAPVMIVAIETASAGRRVPLHAVAGPEKYMYRLASEGKGVIASENLALLHGYKLGGTLDIPSADGLLRVPIVGIVRDYSDQQGSLLMDRAFYVRHWHDDTVNIFRLYLHKGAAAPQVKRAILDKLAGKYRIFVLGNADVRRYILDIAGQWLGLTYVQIAVAVLVAILGIVNMLTVSIVDRRRELGLLRAIGGFRAQIRRTLWLEAVSVGAIGLVLGLALGAPSLYYGLEISRRDVIGLRLAYEFPFAIALLLVPVILGAALLSALVPAESAARGSLVEALKYE
ncbi:MAG: FtsX-like permease family protein [Bryobacteraceae bacterium]